MKHKFTITFIIFILQLMMFSCQSDELVSLVSGGEGKLVISGVNVDMTTSDGKATVSSRGTFDAPEVSEITFTVTNIETNKSHTQIGLPDELVLQAGKYKLEAVYGENVIGLTPYLYAVKEFTITSGNVTTINDFKIELGCAIVRTDLSEELVSQYDGGCTLTLSESENTDKITFNDKEDVFVPAGKSYIIEISGINFLGEEKVFSYNINDIVIKNRYVLKCNAQLPSFNLPQQSEGNVWSKKIFITPMTEENISNLMGLTSDYIIDNIKYEASSDGKTWFVAESDDEGNMVIKGLEPNTSYTIRSRFGAVISDNTQLVTTEDAKELENGNMEGWTSNKIHSGNGTWDRDLYCDYCTGWNTRNEITTKGGENANSGGIFGTLKGNGYSVSWRWYSSTIPVSVSDMGNVAEISTLAFYNEKVSGIWSRSNVYSKTKDNGTAYAGYLFTGSFNKDNDTYDLGISHNSRPDGISFTYQYSPIEGDQCIAYAKLYDSTKKEIASTEVFNSNQQSEFKTEILPFIYTDKNAKAAYIGVFFQSGTVLDISKMSHFEGGYSASPFGQDKILGSVLKIDDVKLIYD
ncbi:MAG: DUF4493 domain-containing protein [Phocaeicola sp.]|nr:DUF4493 domain-containing protein [Phocaeicola sp.]